MSQVASWAAATLVLAACVGAPPPPIPPSSDPEPPVRHHRIDYLEFTVTSLAEAKRFYGEAFGWTFTDYGDAYVGIRTLDGTGEMGGFRPDTTVQAGGPLVILYSDDLPASLEAVRAAGGTITTEPFDFPGGRRFHFRDPFGNELAVWSEASGS